MLPIINQLQWKLFKRLIQPNQLRKAPYCIILSPTRELAAQLYNDACVYAVNTRVKVARSYGTVHP
jgi:superfamily II DNA/RNA helicase